ncbi:hypothetical protein AMAG_05454 [Allomyces macrogynus ATCC 38327]|uniref:Sel1 repeat protein n=1 Tax=Allomyces macrogynus (strain ATCC 38327) TaxID=578462 RepID=A0A0L0SC98_ALLM3|nr:hypothetical protein AMAG_05454 [Allomyces macrogynus ATCC 38327]|eukprot:KNE60015.1 hypothetical protein AMAG_05454 [Allomyces macrogynus ATCC 38327]
MTATALELLNAGHKHYYGENGTAIDLKAAFDAYTKAAALGNAEAIYATSYMEDHEMVPGKKEADYVKAAQGYLKAWEAGQVPMAAAGLAFLYLDGDGVEESKETAQEWFDKALPGLKERSERANPDRAAMYWLANAYLDGDFVDEDVEKALELLQAAAKLGSVEAMCTTGVVYQSNASSEEDLKRAFKWISMAADKNHPVAMCTLADMLLQGVGCDVDADRAKELYQRAYNEFQCTDGLVGLGAMYMEGEGLEKDEAKAIQLWEQAASEGDAEAMFALAQNYLSEENIPKAVPWLEKAGDKGHTVSLNTLGMLNFTGEGIPINVEKAIKLHERAAALKDTDAMYVLGQLYHEGSDQGTGVKKDYAKAMEWYLRGASRGDASSMHAISEMYEKGQGVAKSEEKAREWAERAEAAADSDDEDWEDDDCCDDEDCDGCEDHDHDEHDHE